MRLFDTGATRDNDETKHDPEGFESPLVFIRFCEYMTKHRKQADGNLRDSDNWQKGIPLAAYMKSMFRHMMDVWLHHRGLGYLAKEPLEEALCAMRFNVNGYLYETLKSKQDIKWVNTETGESGTVKAPQGNGKPKFDPSILQVSPNV